MNDVVSYQYAVPEEQEDHEFNGAVLMSELQALLLIQRHDTAITEIESRREALGPREVALDKARQRAVEEAARAESALNRELDKLHALEANISEHKERHEKNLGVLNQAHKLKEATAAMSQVETGRRQLADEESDLLTLTRRIADLRSAAEAHAAASADIEGAQKEERDAIAADRASIDSELAAARSKRLKSSKDVSAPLLFKYDRVWARRKSTAVFPLGNGFSCGNCDTAMALQRRPAMSSGTMITTCEGCGVLLYQPKAPAAAG